MPSRGSTPQTTCSASCRPDLQAPFDPREVIARIVDDSRLRRVQAALRLQPGHRLGRLHGYPVGILANARGVLFSEEAQKAAQFIQLANRRDTPLLFLHNTTGYMVGQEYEQGGIIKHGAMMINAVSNSTVPHLSVLLGASYGAGHYGMCGRAYDPRFLFAWPSAKSAVMGPQQLAGVLSSSPGRRPPGRASRYDEDGDAACRHDDRAADRGRVAADVAVRAGSTTTGSSTRATPATVLGLCLSAIHNAPVEGAGAFGVFRM